MKHKYLFCTISILTASALALSNILYNFHFNSSAEETSFILTEAETQTVLEENNSAKHLNCGAISKLMSLLIIANDIETGKYSTDDILTASQSVNGTKGSVIWLQPGDKLSVDELLKSVIIGNANDAMTVLAEKSCQSVEKFTEEMNKKAFEIGLRDSAFMSPYGYYSKDEYTTSGDIAIICSELSKFNFLKKYFTTWRDFVKNGKTELVNENTLSRTYKHHIGFKASHSEQSGYCIAEAAINESGEIYVAVVLNAPSENDSFSTAKRLLNKGLTEYKTTVPGFPDEFLVPVKVKNGVENVVEIKLKLHKNVAVKKNISEFTNVSVIPDYISAPVRKGQKIGTVAFYSKNVLIYETDLIAKNDVDSFSFPFIFKKMLLKLL